MNMNVNTKIIYLLIYFPNGQNSQIWARLKSGARISTGPSSATFLFSASAGSWTGNATAGILNTLLHETPEAAELIVSLIPAFPKLFEVPKHS